MNERGRSRVGVLSVALVLASVVGATAAGAAAPRKPTFKPVAKARCAPGSRPETGMQGRVSTADVESGRAARGYTCNTTLVGHYGTAGGYRVHRYVDAAGHECAFYDSTLLFPKDALTSGMDGTGVYVLDMSDPAHPVKTANLVTAAMQSPHESLSLNATRGLLAANLGNPVTYPSIVDVYDVREDCRHPVLKSSFPVGGFGHEGAFSPDGRTFWVASPSGNLAAVDVSDPSLPSLVWRDTEMQPHGLNISDDGNTLYYADLGPSHGLAVLDVHEIQQRVANPSVRQISHLTWNSVSTPQVPLPVTIGGRPFLVEIDEFASGGGGVAGVSASPTARVGAARIIDIADPRHPRETANIRLEVHMPANRVKTAGDPGADSSLAGYTGHYCAVPRRHEPGIVACSFILSGLRVIDIRDPYNPKEIAYFNQPVRATLPGDPISSYAMSAPAFVRERGEIWYTDGNSGFYAIRVRRGVWPFR